MALKKSELYGSHCARAFPPAYGFPQTNFAPAVPPVRLGLFIDTG
jgi:hypothetical protein